MKKTILFTLLTICISYTFAQTITPDTALRSLVKIDLSLPRVGLSYEPRISNKFTIDLSAGLGGGYNINNKRVYYRFDHLEPTPYFSITPKFYYNRNKRISSGKKSQNNAGNYVGLSLTYSAGYSNLAGSENVNEALLANVHWGIQRPLGDRWLLNAHAGIGYGLDPDYGIHLDTAPGSLYPALDFKFSYVLNKLRSR